MAVTMIVPVIMAMTVIVVISVTMAVVVIVIAHGPGLLGFLLQRVRPEHIEGRRLRIDDKRGALL
jgi:hypothetical protein